MASVLPVWSMSRTNRSSPDGLASGMIGRAWGELANSGTALMMRCKLDHGGHSASHAELVSHYVVHFQDDAVGASGSGFAAAQDGGSSTSAAARRSPTTSASGGIHGIRPTGPAGGPGSSAGSSAPWPAAAQGGARAARKALAWRGPRTASEQRKGWAAPPGTLSSGRDGPRLLAQQLLHGLRPDLTETFAGGDAPWQTAASGIRCNSTSVSQIG